MTTYDPPGITDPENVDALTHQQIYDAFQTVTQSAGDVVAAWQQAGSQWRTSTTGLVRAVRSAVDGHWTGASAEAAVNALVDYGNQAGELADLFDAAGQAVSNTAQAALTTKAYIPKPVPVNADQTKDPSGFDRQTRDASKAQDDARQVMQQRYVTPFTDQDKRIPTFPAAVPVGNGDAAASTSESDSRAPATSTNPAAWRNGTRPDSTAPASVTSLLHDLPFPASVDATIGRFLQNPSSAMPPSAGDVLFQQPTTSRPERADRNEGTPPPAATRPANVPAASTPTTPSSVRPDAAAPSADGEQRDPTQQRPNSAPQQADPKRPHSTPEQSQPAAEQPTTPARTQTQATSTSTDAVRPGHDSAATPSTGGSSANSAPPPNSTPAPSAPPAGSSGPVPGGSTPNLAGPALGSAGSIPAVPSPVPGTPAPAPATPMPATPVPSAPTPMPSNPAPAPNFAAPAPTPNPPAPGANAATPAPNVQVPPPGSSAPSAPKPVPSTPVPGAHAPAAAQATPARPTVDPLPPDVLAEPAAAAVTGAATAEVLSEPGHHHTGADHRPPRLRVRYEGDRDRTGKKVDLRHESHTAEMAGRDEHVQPTIGE